MTPLVFAVVLGAAVLHAGWNALVKHGGDPFLRLAIVNLTGTAICLPLLLVVPPPVAAAWPWIAASVAIHIAYCSLLCLAYRLGDLSQVYPVARGVVTDKNDDTRTIEIDLTIQNEAKETRVVGTATVKLA